MTGIEPLRRADPQCIAQRLAAEHPQIVAAILVHLDIELAASVLKICTERLRNDVVLRIATMKDLRPAVLKDLRDVLRAVLAEPQQVPEPALGGVGVAAAIINQMGATLGPLVMASIRGHNPDLARTLATHAARNHPDSSGRGAGISAAGATR